MQNGSQTFIPRIIKNSELDKDVLYTQQNKEKRHVVIYSNNNEGMDHDETSETGSLFHYLNCTVTPGISLVTALFSNRTLDKAGRPINVGEHEILLPNKKVNIGDIYVEGCVKIDETLVMEDDGSQSSLIKATFITFDAFVVSKVYKKSIVRGNLETIYEVVLELSTIKEYTADKQAACEVKFKYPSANSKLLNAINYKHYREQILNNALIESSKCNMVEHEAINTDIFQYGEFIGPAYIPQLKDETGVVTVSDDPTGDGKLIINFDRKDWKTENIETNPQYEKVKTENAKKKEELIKFLESSNILINFKTKEETQQQTTPSVQANQSGQGTEMVDHSTHRAQAQQQSTGNQPLGNQTGQVAQVAQDTVSTTVTNTVANAVPEQSVPTVQSGQVTQTVQANPVQASPVAQVSETKETEDTQLQSQPQVQSQQPQPVVNTPASPAVSAAVPAEKEEEAEESEDTEETEEVTVASKEE